MSFAQVRARFGAARIALEDCNPEASQITSSIQKRAIISLLSQRTCQISLDEISRLNVMVNNIPFAIVDKCEILRALDNKSKMQAVTRRESQDMVHFIYYLSSREWVTAQQDMESAQLVATDVLLRRLGCVNASEHTFQRMLGFMFACNFSHDQIKLVKLEDKSLKLTKLKADYRRQSRKFQEQLKKMNREMPYLTELPMEPQDLDPELFGRFKVQDCFVQPMIDLKKITTFELCTGVRLGSSLPQSRTVVSPQGSTEHGGSMQNQLLSMLGHLLQQHKRNDDIDITYDRNSRKRSLRELSMSDEDKMNSLRRCTTVREDGCGVPALKDGSATDVSNGAPKSPEPKNVSNGVPEPNEVPEPKAVSESSEQALKEKLQRDSKLNGASILDGLLTRDALKKENAKVEKAAAKAAAKLQAAAMTPKKEKGQTSKSTPSKKPYYAVNHEASRKQYLARSKNGSRTFSYNKEKANSYPTAAKAMSEAKKWLTMNQ